jgi:CLIP-associating protein 1/2
MEEEPLLEALPEMLPGLFEAFNDSNADVRKAVVFCLVRRKNAELLLKKRHENSICSRDSRPHVCFTRCFAQVDIYMVLGPQFEAYLGELNASQLRLVRIYINRMNKARSERAAGALGQPNAQAES